jgi:hypothetical protein
MNYYDSDGSMEAQDNTYGLPAFRIYPKMERFLILIIDLLYPENHRPDPVRTTSDHGPVILHPPTKQSVGKISSGKEHGNHRVDVTPCPVTEIIGLFKAAGELLPDFKARAGCDLFHTVYLRQFRVEALFNDGNLALGHMVSMLC